MRAARHRAPSVLSRGPLAASLGLHLAAAGAVMVSGLFDAPAGTDAAPAPPRIEMHTARPEIPPEDGRDEEVVEEAPADPGECALPLALPEDPLPPGAAAPGERRWVAASLPELRARRLLDLGLRPGTWKLRRARRPAPPAPLPAAPAAPARRARRQPPESTTAPASPAEGANREPRPIPALCAAPLFPRAAERRGLSGRVRLRLLVGIDGRVEKVWVHESSGHSCLDRAAREAVTTWRFEPALRAGKPFAREILVPIRFGRR